MIGTKYPIGMKILSSSASYFLLMRSVRGGMQNHAFLQSIKRSFHPPSGPNNGPINNYKHVLRGEINRKQMSLAGDAVMLDRMMDDFYVPVYIYIKGILDRHQSQTNTATSHQPLFIGISAPQGCGKTTLTEFMRALFAADGKNCLSVSIDDFYLRGNDQDSLAARYSILTYSVKHLVTYPLLHPVTRRFPLTSPLSPPLSIITQLVDTTPIRCWNSEVTQAVTTCRWC